MAGVAKNVKKVAERATKVVKTATKSPPKAVKSSKASLTSLGSLNGERGPKSQSAEYNRGYSSPAYEESFDEGAHPGHISSTEVLDEVEKAQMLQLQEIAHLTNKARELSRPQSHPDFDGKHCLDCDEPIPEVRLKNGYILCVDCKTIQEKEDKRKKNLYG